MYYQACVFSGGFVQCGRAGPGVSRPGPEQRRSNIRPLLCLSKSGLLVALRHRRYSASAFPRLPSVPLKPDVRDTVDVTVLSSSVEGTAHQFAASYVVNQHLVIDAGSIGFAGIERQRAINSIVLSHIHLDHVASLPILIDNVYQPDRDCPTVYASQHVIDNLKAHFFNDIVWPDLIRLACDGSPFIRFVPLEDRSPVEIHGLTVTPIALDHVIPTFGFIVDDGKSAVAFVSDTGPTMAIWECVKSHPRIKLIFLEAAFPNSMSWLADKAKHLTPASFAIEYGKVGRALPVIAVHIKPGFYDEVVSELQQLGIDGLSICQPNQSYTC